MSPAEITKLIYQDLEGNLSQTNLHKIDLRKCLINPPIKKHFEDSFRKGKMIEMWLVLDEDPESHSGHKIVFDEVTKKFGLAYPGLNKIDTFIGFNGSFLSAFMSM